MSLKVVKLHPDATLPTRGTPYAAGLDLYTLKEILIEENSCAMVETGIAVSIPEGYYGRIAPRSGVSVRTGLVVNAGVVDSDYRGELKVVFNNFTDSKVTFCKGDKIAQLILEKIGMFEVEEVASLNNTERGAGGFGSTGN